MNTTDIAPRLRLRHGSWNALRSVIAGERVPRSELRELWDLNVLDGTALTDPAQELLEGLTGMAGVVHVLGSDAGALRSASVWVAADGVGLLDQIDGDYTILQRVERGIVPPSIVELLNLGPRPQLTEPESQTVPASLVNNVLEPSGDAAEPWTDLADAIEGSWPTISHAIDAGGWRCWLLQGHTVADGAAHVRATVCLLRPPAGRLHNPTHRRPPALSPRAHPPLLSVPCLPAPAPPPPSSLPPSRPNFPPPTSTPPPSPPTLPPPTSCPRPCPPPSPDPPATFPSLTTLTLLP